ncbi:MAG: CvpA family protein [Treponema sp.]|jgi:membrane protein required for colicin V production|nr:CvpA family protein [Treponema sp.]
MNPPVLIDIFFIILGFILMIRSALRGFVTEFMSLMAVLCGFAVAVLLYRSGGAFLREKFMGGIKYLPEIIAFGGLFFILFAFVKLMEYMLTEIVDRIKLYAVDRFLGFVLGIAEALVVISLILLLFTVQPLFDEGPILRGSVFSEYLLPFIRGEGWRPVVLAGSRAAGSAGTLAAGPVLALCGVKKPLSGGRRFYMRGAAKRREAGGFHV